MGDRKTYGGSIKRNHDVFLRPTTSESFANVFALRDINSAPSTARILASPELGPNARNKERLPEILEREMPEIFRGPFSKKSYFTIQST